MNVKMKEIVVAANGKNLQSLGSVKDFGKFTKAPYWIGKLLNELQKELDAYEKARVSLVSKCGGDVATNKEIPPENAAEYTKGLAELLEMDVELKPEKIKISAETKGLSAHDFNALAPFIEVIE